MARIPLETSKTIDIYDLGFNKNLNRDIPKMSTGVVYDSIGDSLNTGQIISGGALTLKALTIGGLTKQVSQGDDIQAAIDMVNREGGGTIQFVSGTYKLTSNIELKANVALVGAGKGITILDFEGRSFGILVKGTSSNNILENINIRDLTIQNSNNTAGVDIDYCDFWRMENVRITSCDQKGLRVRYSRNFMIVNVLSNANTGNGFEFVGDGNRSQIVYSLINCRSSNNDIGYSFSGNDHANYSLLSCGADNNSGDGFDFAGGLAAAATITGGRSDTNGGIGYDIDVQDITFEGAVSDLNTGDGFEVSQLNVRLIGCKSAGNGTEYDINTSATIIGCGIPFSSTTIPSDEFSETDTQNSKIWGSYGGNTRTEKLSYRMKNTSGATINAGNVVTFKAAAGGDEITTTTSQGDDLVFGMALTTIANNAYGAVLFMGYTKLLKVDGTTDIAIGDFLGTFTSAGIAMKAAAGDMAFAIALEAYTANDSLGVIDALIISPRKI